MSIRYPRLGRRFLAYSVVGITTYLIDLFIIYGAVTRCRIDTTVAIALGFLISINLNYFFCYTWVFHDTTQNPLAGYLLFSGVALIGALVITSSTTYLIATLSLNPYLARTIVAVTVGSGNFFFNTFFNFRVYN